MTDKNNNEKTNQNTADKIASSIDVVSNRISAAGWILLRWVGFGLLLYPVVASVFGFLPMPDLSDRQIVFVSSFIISMLVLYLPTSKFISRFWSPQIEYIAKIDGSDESVLNLWYASPNKIRNMNVIDGTVRSKNIEGEIVHLVNDFDPVQNTAKGPRSMEVTDWEMWGEKEAIKRQRHRNNVLIEYGKQVFIRLPDLGQIIEGKYWKEMSIKQTEKELTDPESFLNSVEDELPDIDQNVTDEMRAAVQKSTEEGDKDE